MDERLRTIRCGIGSEYSLMNKVGRVVWGIVWVIFVRPSPRFLHAWRKMIYGIFGAKLGRGTRIYSKVRVWAPWNLECDESVAIADYVEIYNPAKVSIGRDAVISQGAYLCTASHDVDDPMFPLVLGHITVGCKAWVAARAVVLPGVQVNEGAVLALGAVAVRDLDAWTVYGGIPAKVLRARKKA
jgi:putative colanic acid biosynthesis acetyltransferase WcaF